jgi:hypothetical protein
MATAWGHVHLLVGNALATGEMPADAQLTDLGAILDDSVSMETAEGETLELRETGGNLIDQLQGENTYTLNLTVIGVERENVEQFWNIEEDDNDPDKFWVKSTVTNDKFAVRFSSDVVGAKYLDAPKCTMKWSLNYAKAEGWTLVGKITFLKSESGKVFGMGITDASLDIPSVTPPIEP